MKVENDRHQWFMDRIGKRVYVAGWACECSYCTSMKNNGEVIKGHHHLECLLEIESISEGSVRYFDTMEEVLEFKQKEI